MEAISEEFVDAIHAKYGGGVCKINLSSNGLRYIHNITRLSNDLQRLNLSCNDIADLRPLAALHALRELDLSSNALSSTDALRCLADLRNLRTIKLSENPMYSPHEEFAAGVFRLLPHVTKVDDFERSACDLSKVSTSSSSSPAASGSGTAQSEAARALELQLESMEQLFALQDEVLGKSGYQAGQQALADSCSQQPSDIDSLPYVKLLQALRQELMKSKAGTIDLERRLEEASKGSVQLRARLGDAERETSAQSLLLAERTASLTRKMEALRVQLAAAEEGSSDARARASKAEALSARSALELSALRAALETAKVGLEGSLLGSQVQLMQRLQGLRAMEERLQHAARRVAFASSVVAQKEVVLRNSQAAVEGERRMLAAGAASGSAGGGLLSALQLQPEAEGILLSLFRGLDTNDSGAVSAALLLSVLVEGGAAEAASAQEVFGDSMGAEQWARLVAALRAAGDAELTWGELLLMLLPAAPAQQRAAALSAAESEGLRRAGLLGDGEWGVARLRVDMPAPQPSSSSPPSKEVSTLLAERSYLLARLQAMGRALERRAEGIKAFFEADLAKAQLREGRSQQQCKELRDACSSLEARAAEAEAAWRAERERREARAAALEMECSQLRSSLDSRLGGELARHEAAAAEERARYSRLETEHTLLQREHSKRDVRLKALQRDVVRLQAAMAAAGTDHAVLERRVEEEAAAARELRQSSSDLTVRALEAEQEVSRLRERLAEAERLRVAEAASVDSAAAAPEPPAAEALRAQMGVLRSLPKESATQADVYTAHLTKLLRLAEDAINKS